MKIVATSATIESSTGDTLLVEVRGVGKIYFESWSNGYKQYQEFVISEITSVFIRELLADWNLIVFCDVEICNLIHYSGVFYES
jgi:hypothetical protein